MRRIVHADPVCDFLRYEGFVFAAGVQLAESWTNGMATRTKSVECFHADALGLSKVIIVEHLVLRVAVHRSVLEGSFKVLQTYALPVF